MITSTVLRSSSVPAPIDIRVVDTADGMAALADDWEALSREATLTSVFATADWQTLWWRHYGRGHALRVLVASSAGAVVGILPVYIRTESMLRYPVRVLRFVGSGGDTFPDDLGPLLARGREAEIGRALAETIAKMPGWDVLLLEDMDPRCPFTAELEAALRRARLPSESGRSQRIAYIDLPATWEAWLASLHRDRRYRIKNIRKKLLAAHPDARFFVWSDPSTIDAGIDRLVHLHHKRWSQAGQTHAFSTDAYVGFHRAVMKACLAKDRLRLYCLELGGQVVAMFYFYRFRDRVYLMQSGFDPDFGNVKPGQVLLGYIIENAISEKFTVLDFLRGDHRYKDELASGERETVYVKAFRYKPGALVYRTRREVLPVVKARLKQALARVRPPKAADDGETEKPSE
jgi:CelD/BcsL family acetyltransferase involved in cellulose biosynthesis